MAKLTELEKKHAEHYMNFEINKEKIRQTNVSIEQLASSTCSSVRMDAMVIDFKTYTSVDRVQQMKDFVTPKFESIEKTI